MLSMWYYTYMMNKETFKAEYLGDDSYDVFASEAHVATFVGDEFQVFLEDALTHGADVTIDYPINI